MSYAALPEIHEDLDHLKQHLRTERHPERKRLEVAEHLAVHRNTTGCWLKRYEEGDLQRLLKIKPRSFTPSQRTVSENVVLFSCRRTARN